MFPYSMAQALGLRCARTVATLALLLAIVACATTPLSGGRTGAATARESAPPIPAVAAPPAAVPTPLLPAPPLVAPSPAGSSTVITRPLPPAEAAPRAASDVIALLLPLESAAYRPAAEAVRAGFLAAAVRAGVASRVRVIGHGDDGVLPALAAAADAGVALVVGPLTRDDLKTVIAMAPSRPRMLALNQTDDGSAPPENVYALALSFDSDAAQLARAALADGARSVAVIASSGALQRRFAAAFGTEWQSAGRAPLMQFAFDANPVLLGQFRRELASRPPDAVLLAIDGDDIALAKSFLPPGRVYAVSHIADDLPPTMLRDLEGVRYVEIPWIAMPQDLAPTAPTAPAAPPRIRYESPLQERLYALGLDALALAQMLAEPVPPDRVELDGATGHLSLMPSRTFARQGTMMVIHDGRTMPEPAGR
ncbi:MAG: penicillin-binding protein activator [Pseudomonadota bacterium]|nr:penicillin-binding protein activator [Pseudomonadota bacterium]